MTKKNQIVFIIFLSLISLLFLTCEDKDADSEEIPFPEYLKNTQWRNNDRLGIKFSENDYFNLIISDSYSDEVIYSPGSLFVLSKIEKKEKFDSVLTLYFTVIGQPKLSTPDSYITISGNKPEIVVINGVTHVYAFWERVYNYY
jgi:hypothetical protein